MAAYVEIVFDNSDGKQHNNQTIVIAAVTIALTCIH